MVAFVKVAVIQAEISVKQKDCENDLAKAEPSLSCHSTPEHTQQGALFYPTRQNSIKSTVILKIM